MRRGRAFTATLLVCAALAPAVVGCPGDPPFPGDESLGEYHFVATLIEDGCGFGEVDGGFEFNGIFSRLSESGAAWFTLNGVSRSGTFDGALFESSFSARRHFVSRCEPDGGADGGGVDAGRDAGPKLTDFNVDETLTTVLLSPSQLAALDGGCPQDPATLLQPGAVPLDPDGGIVAPSLEDGEFTAVRACGVLVDDIRPVLDSCIRPQCRLRYRVDGVRQR